MNPILIDLGFIQLRWYSVLILVAFSLGYYLVLKRAKKCGISTIHINDMCFYLVVLCILGARLYYCLFYVDIYGYNIYFEKPLEILKIWEGGLAIHGGIIAGLLFLFFYSKKKKLNLLQLLDIFAPALALGQAIGRWGNFFNQEAYGKRVTIEFFQNLHIPKFITDGMYIKDNLYPTGAYRTPTFLFESIGCLIIFIVLMIIRNRKRIKTGQVVALYLILYGILRFFIEQSRVDNLKLFNFKIAQLVSIIMLILGIVLLVLPIIRRKYDKQKMG